MKYGILGSGSANPKVIQDGLADILAADPAAVFVIHGRRAPQGSVGTVYDFLVDNECKFRVAHRVDDNTPKALINLSEVDQTCEDPAKYIVTISDEILILWDEENEEASQNLSKLANENGLPVKDLTTALTPVAFEAKDPVEEKTAVEQVSEILPFTREELLNANIGVLRRQAKNLGIELGVTTKEKIVDAILAAVSAEPEVASDVHAPQEPQAMVVYMENGVYMTVQVPLKDIKNLLS